MELPSFEIMQNLSNRGFEQFIFGKIFIENNKKVCPVYINKYETLISVQAHEVFDKSLEDIVELDDSYLNNIFEEAKNSMKLIYHISHKYVDSEESSGEFSFSDPLTTTSLKTLKTTDYFKMEEFTPLREGKMSVTFEWRRDDNEKVVQSVMVSPDDIDSVFNNEDDYKTIYEGASMSYLNFKSSTVKKIIDYILRFFS